MLGILLTLLFAGQQGTSPGLLLVYNPRHCIAVRVKCHRLLGYKYFDLIHIYLIVIVYLQFVQDFTQLFMGQGDIVLVFIIHIILHDFWESILSRNANIILRELSFADS